MHHLALAVASLLVASGCYSGTRATRDVNHAWLGHSRADLEARWGTPSDVVATGEATTLVWTRYGRRIDLPRVSGRLDVAPDGFEASARIEAGRITRTSRHVIAETDATGHIVSVEGRTLRYGPPPGLNMRWGFLLGFHAGMGRLDDTETPLPGGGLYIGGMLSPTLGLVGAYSMSSGNSDDGGAMAFAWSLGAQKWVASRLWLRAGPAMILGFDPGFNDVGLEPGIATAASYAVVRSGSFVLDVRADLNVGTKTRFGVLGIGVNIN